MKKRGVSDESLIRRECYNAGGSEIFLELMSEKIDYIKVSGITPGYKLVSVKPGEFAVINHAFYRLHTKDGRPANVVWNFGDLIGRKNKLPTNPNAVAMN